MNNEADFQESNGRSGMVGYEKSTTMKGGTKLDDASQPALNRHRN